MNTNFITYQMSLPTNQATLAILARNPEFILNVLLSEKSLSAQDVKELAIIIAGSAGSVWLTASRYSHTEGETQLRLWSSEPRICHGHPNRSSLLIAATRSASHEAGKMLTDLSDELRIRSQRKDPLGDCIVYELISK
jgi:hypothetical protein